MKRRTLRDRIRNRIARCRDDVFLTREFRDLGGEDQVRRALRALMRDGELVRLGYGVYGRVEKSQLTGRPMLAAPGGVIDLVCLCPRSNAAEMTWHFWIEV